jgi:RNA polymerase sigma-70 factor (ECF subfamily)
VRADDGFQGFYQAEFAKVFRAALVICKNPDAAEDATQEAFARALERWRRLREEPWAPGWVITTAMNLARRGTRRRSLLGRPAAGPADEETRLDLWERVRALPPKQQTAMILHYAIDLPIAEVAAAMGCAEGSVKAHLAKARQNLRTALETPDE